MTDPETRAIPVDVEGLCERLRKPHWMQDRDYAAAPETISGTVKLMRAERTEAATALETLAAENARLHSLAKANNTLARMNGDRATKAEAENARLKDTLDAVKHEVMHGKVGEIRSAIMFLIRAALSPVTQVKESGRG